MKMSNTMLRTANGIQEVSLGALHQSKRLVELYTEIDNELACDTVNRILYLNWESTREPIHLRICSPGGSVRAGLMIYDAMMVSKAPIYTYAEGMAYSMAGVLLAAGAKGHRYVNPHTQVMLHEPLLQSLSGSTSDVRKISEEMLANRDMLNSILSRHTGQSTVLLEKELAYDHFFTAQQAVEFGLADAVGGFELLMEFN